MGAKKKTDEVSKIWNKAIKGAKKDISRLKSLLDKDLYFLGAIDTQLSEHEYQQVDPRVQMSITHWLDEHGDPFIPVFSSLALMNENAEDIGSYMSLSGQDFFEITLGEVLILDPGSENELILSSEEVSCLLARHC